MAKKRREKPVLRIEPEKRICPQFDALGMETFPAAAPEETGVWVLDDCCEEHIQ